jgi:hypothetical protein
VPTSFSSEFDTTDVGAGARLAWRPAAWLVRRDSFFSHDFRFAAGVGFRF